MSDLQRIVADLERAKQRITDLSSGALGRNDDGHHTRNRALEGQINAQRQHVAKLEYELVIANIAEGKWQCAAIIEAMS